MLAAVFIAQLLDPVRIIACGLGHYAFVRPRQRQGQARGALLLALVVAAGVTLGLAVLLNAIGPRTLAPDRLLTGFLAATAWMGVFAGLGRLWRKRAEAA